MLIRSRGFTLAETVIAMLLSSLLLLTAARFLPQLQYQILRQAQAQIVRQNLWHLAFTIGKQLQRAGYFNHLCHHKGLYLEADGHCLVVSWQAQALEYTAYRLHAASLETRRNISDCQGKGWEKITDPAQLRITQFQVQLQPRSRLPPLLHILISATAQGSRHSISLRHTVVGYNL